MLTLNPLVEEFDPRLFRRCGTSQANRDLHAIHETAQLLLDQVRGFLATHKPGCRCVWCRVREECDKVGLAQDLTGLVYNVNIASDIVESMLVALPQDKDTV
jgi:hypothetical protein